MKKCKIIHINDGTAVTITNGERHFAVEFPWAESVIDEYLNDGYEVKQMIPEISPAVVNEDPLTFYKSGFTIYLEKEE